MAATTSTPTPRKNGFDFAALTASAGKQDSGDEVARLRAALETLAELVIAHGVMDARTLQSIVGDLIAPPMMPVSLAAPLPPPAPSAAEALLRGPIPKPAPVAARPVAARPVAKAAPAAKTIAAPAPVAANPAPVAAKPSPVAAPTAPTIMAPAPAPVAVAPAPVAVAPAPVAVPAPVVDSPSGGVVVPPSSVQPVVASPFPSEPPPAVAAPAPAAPATAAAARKNPFDARDAARLEAELTDTPPPALKPQGFFSRLFGKPKTSPAAVAKSAASIEFTERVAKLPVDGLYSEQQRATELSFPPAASIPKRPRAAAPARKKAVRPANAAPARFCDRCWRRIDESGTCKTCSPSASA